MKACKKFYKKVDISVWFFIMLLPVIIGFINSVGFACNLYRYGSYDYNDFMNYIYVGFSNGILNFMDFVPNFLYDTFFNLFDSIGLVGSSTLLIVICSWFVWVVYLHLLVDILAFIPKFFHNFLRRVDKYDE